MQTLHPVLSALIVAAVCGVTYAQTAPAETEAHAGGCDALNESVPDNVRSIANTLNICGDVQRVLNGRSRIAPPGALEEQRVVPDERGQAPSPTQEQLAKNDTVGGLEARQRVSEAITRATLDVNLVSLQLRNVLIERQIASFNAEQRAYRRTKILNAFLGTTVGAVGSGLQFSNSASVQHVGDGVSVAGGAVTAVLALCTAGIDEKDSPPDDPLSQALRSDNQGHEMPDDVWSYLRSAGVVPALAENFVPRATSGKKWLSCHFRGAPKDKDKEFMNSERALTVLNNALLRMNRDLTDLSNVTFH